MKRVVKLEGKGNIAIEEIEVPGFGKDEVLVKVCKFCKNGAKITEDRAC